MIKKSQYLYVIQKQDQIKIAQLSLYLPLCVDDNQLVYFGLFIYLIYVWHISKFLWLGKNKSKAEIWVQLKVIVDLSWTSADSKESWWLVHLILIPSSGFLC